MNINISNRPLSLKEVKDILKYLGWFNDFEVGLYSNINWNNNRPRFILINSDSNLLMGHFVLTYNNNNDNVVYWDLSGNKPLEIFSKFHLNQNRQDGRLMYNYFKKFNNIDYNPIDYQKSDKSATCAHSCIVRYYYKDLNNDKFNKFIKIIKNRFGYKNIDDLMVDLLKAIINNK